MKPPRNNSSLHRVRIVTPTRTGWNTGEHEHKCTRAWDCPWHSLQNACRSFSGALLQLPLLTACKPIFITDLGDFPWGSLLMFLSLTPLPATAACCLSSHLTHSIYMKAEHQCLILSPAPSFTSPISLRPLDQTPTCHHHSVSCYRQLVLWSSSDGTICTGYFFIADSSPTPTKIKAVPTNPWVLVSE